MSRDLTTARSKHKPFSRHLKDSIKKIKESLGIQTRKERPTESLTLSDNEA